MDVARPRDISAFLASRPKDFKSCLQTIKQYGNWLFIAERNNSPSELIKAIEDTLFHLRYCYYIYEEEESCEGVYFKIAYERLFPDLKISKAKEIESRSPVKPIEIDILEIIDQRYGTNTVEESASAYINSDREETICASSPDDQCVSEVSESSAKSEQYQLAEGETRVYCEALQQYVVITGPQGASFISQVDYNNSPVDSESAAVEDDCGSSCSDSYEYSDIPDKHWSDDDSESTNSEQLSQCVPELLSEHLECVEFVDPPLYDQCHSECEPQVKQYVQFDGQTIDVVPLCRDSVNLDPIGQSSVLLRSMCSDNITFGKDFVSVVRTGRSVKRYDLRSLCVPALAKDLVQLAGGR